MWYVVSERIRCVISYFEIKTTIYQNCFRNPTCILNIHNIFFFSTLKLLGVGCTCTLSLMCEFRVHGGVKFAVYMVQGCTMYWYRGHRLRCIQVFFELFYTILVIQNFYRLYCIGDDWSVHCFWGVVMLVLFLYFLVVDFKFFLSISFSIQSCDRLVTHRWKDITQ